MGFCHVSLSYMSINNGESKVTMILRAYAIYQKNRAVLCIACTFGLFCVSTLIVSTLALKYDVFHLLKSCIASNIGDKV